MAQSNPYELDLSRKVLRVLLVINPISGFFILALLIASVFAEGFMMEALIHEHGSTASAESRTLIAGMRWIMGFGVIAAVLIQVALRRLLAIVETVREGDPFLIINAERLKTIAWTVLGLEVLHFVIGMIARSISTETHPLDIDWKFNGTRWLVVLFLFVLARVFEQGARMRDDLEGTI
jgi:hypothetical protein